MWAGLLLGLAITAAPAWAGVPLSGPWDQLDSTGLTGGNGNTGYALREDIEVRFLASAIGDSLT